MTDQAFPPLLSDLLALPYWSDDEEFDFEPYPEFLSAADTRDWIRAWTGRALEGADLRVFGQDGSGGHAAIWLARPDADLLEQPVVFFGSEGEVGVVARDVADYLWLLAGGLGPMEAVDGLPPVGGALTEPFVAFAERHAPASRRAPAEILAIASAEFPDFADRFAGG